ncbi:MAG TPA: SDR family oxidoreductase [Candidatus Acidoferrales bacterium]|jgi:NAD(P)-dependent dehydrogenase (short-subunit alcohol dehydrogenase family)|nr:SDR family oxidoreductase [Candidatus Acidoferrales bacterium]
MAEKPAAQTTLITGGTEGLGKAIALRLAREGYRVFAAGRNAERREKLAAEAQKLILPITPIEMDVCNDVSVDRALDEIRSVAGPVDVLINNAGVAYGVTMEEIRMEDLRRQFETNYFAAVRLMQRVLPEMRARRSGCIVNMSSVYGRLTLPVMGPYSSSKHALEAMSDALRAEVKPFGVRVILIEPGYIRTNIGNAAKELNATYRPQYVSGPYADVYMGFWRGWKKYTNASTTKPEDCAEIVLGALRSAKPKARYAVPKKAGRGIWFMRMLPSRMTDRMVARDFGPATR